MAAFDGQVVLAVFAHPDDESLACGGTLARLVDSGARVVIMCATHGELSAERTGRDEALGRARACELTAAATALGVQEVILLNHRDGHVRWAEVTTFSAELVLFMRTRRPAAVLTFDEDGLYWHPDHIAICEATTSAIDAMGDEGPALYYVTMPPGQMRRVLDVWDHHDAGVLSPLLGVSNPDAFGVGATPPTLVIDVSACAERKLAALKCHRTQIDGGAFARMTAEEAARFFDVEHFHRPPGSRVRSRHAFLDLLEMGSGVN